MKPRIAFRCGRWVCSTDEHWGNGSSPRDAYKEWASARWQSVVQATQWIVWR